MHKYLLINRLANRHNKPRVRHTLLLNRIQPQEKQDKQGNCSREQGEEGPDHLLDRGLIGNGNHGLAGNGILAGNETGSAQKQGHQVIAEAQEKADAIIAEAQAKADALEDEAVRQHAEAMEKNREEIAKEKEALIEAQQQVADFKKSLFDMYKSHLELISSMPETFEDAAPAYEPETAEEIAAAVAAE